ncbi:MAG TPA: transposase [Vicinamibacterales bacterium]|nr:transposase [Vicinamibacterales bacterium]
MKGGASVTGGASSALTGEIRPDRRSMRLRGFDYSSDGSYFVTILTYRRRFVLKDECRAIVERELLELPRRFDGLTIDCFVVLPDHLHALMRLTRCCASLSAIMQAYKSLTTRLLKPILSIDRLWHRGFRDRIVRSDVELLALRDYVVDNEAIHDQRTARRRL